MSPSYRKVLSVTVMEHMHAQKVRIGRSCLKGVFGKAARFVPALPERMGKSVPS